MTHGKSVRMLVFGNVDDRVQDVIPGWVDLINEVMTEQVLRRMCVAGGVVDAVGGGGSRALPANTGWYSRLLCVWVTICTGYEDTIYFKYFIS